MLDSDENGLELLRIGEADSESRGLADRSCDENSAAVKVNATNANALCGIVARADLLADRSCHGLASLWCGGLELGGLVRAGRRQH